MTAPSGFVDPSIVAAGARQAEILRLIVKRGLRLERRGAALVLSGPGVYVVTTSLASLSAPDTVAKHGEPPAKPEGRSTPREFFAGKRRAIRGNGR